MILKKVSLACMVLSGSAFLAACGGGGDSTATFGPVIPVVTNNISAQVSAPILAALGNTVVTFPNGLAGVDGSGNPVSLTGSTDVSFNGSKTTFTNGGLTASGDTTFGSIIVNIKLSQLPIFDSRSDNGNFFKFDPALLNTTTSGQPANGEIRKLSQTMTLGTSVSQPFKTDCVISRDGTTTCGGILFGKSNVTNVTGLSN